MQHVAVVLSDELTLRRLRKAFSGQCLVEGYPTQVDALSPFIERGEIVAVIVDMRRGAYIHQDAMVRVTAPSPEADPTISFIAALHSRYPVLPIVGYVDFTPLQAREILWAAHAGVREIILREFDDLDMATRRVLKLARIGDVSTRVFAEIMSIVPPDLHEFFRFCVAHAHEGLTMDGVAASIQTNKKTIALRLRRHQLPPPHRIIGWGRVLAASRWLEDSYRPIERVARELHFAGGAGLRNFLRRYMGCRTEELREHGGFAHALRLFVQELREPWDVVSESAE